MLHVHIVWIPAIFMYCPSDPEKSDILQLPSQTFVENIVVAVEPRRNVGSAFAFTIAAFRWLICWQKKGHCLSAAAQHSLHFFQLFSASRVQGSVPQPMRPPCNSGAGSCSHICASIWWKNSYGMLWMEQAKARMNQYWFPKEFHYDSEHAKMSW